MSTRLLERIERELAAAGDPAERVRLQQDRAVALTRLGRIDESRCALDRARVEALAAARAAQARLDDATPAEIRAIVHGNLASMLQELGRADEAREHAALARIAWEATAHEQRETRRLLADVATENGQ